MAPWPNDSSRSAQKFQQQVGAETRRPAQMKDHQLSSNGMRPQDLEASHPQLLIIAGLSVLSSMLIQRSRSRQHTSLASLAALGAALGGLLSRLVPKLLQFLKMIRSKNSVADGKQGRASDATWAPYNNTWPNDRYSKGKGKGKGKYSHESFREGESSQQSFEAPRARPLIGGGNRHINAFSEGQLTQFPGAADRAPTGNRWDNWHRSEGKGMEKGKGKGKGKEKGRTWFEDEYDDPPFWWRNKKDVFFDIEMTAEEDLSSLATPVYQWWDPVVVGEAENFVALSKPAGMRVTTDENGLWEPSPTNFIHVVHQRFDIGSSEEPEQRGICHRLDSHTSGVQIFGRSLEAFGHFTKENSGHRVMKEYLTLVDGRLGDENTPGTGMIDVPIAKYKDFDRRQFGSVICAHQGLPAITKYKALRQWRVPAKGAMAFLGEDRWFTLVHLRILSGRTHQIRIHMAFIGYPVIGDIKHNNTNLEHDAVFLPRIFLHCLKMEFKEFDGSLFVASSDLAPDLQAGLLRIQALTNGGEGDLAATAGAGNGTTPGLARILEDSKKDHEVQYPEAPTGMAEAFPPRSLKYRCLICRSGEEATCTMIQRRSRVAMSWKLVRRKTEEGDQDLRAAPKAKQQKEAGEPCWGPGELWCPTGVQEFEEGSGSLFFAGIR